MFGNSIHTALTHAAIQYDEKQSTKRGYNRYALAQYLQRIEEVESDIAAGASVRAALLSAFNDRLLDVFLVAVDQPKFTMEEKRGGRLLYVPASEGRAS